LLFFLGSIFGERATMHARAPGRSLTATQIAGKLRAMIEPDRIEEYLQRLTPTARQTTC